MIAILSQSILSSAIIDVVGKSSSWEKKEVVEQEPSRTKTSGYSQDMRNFSYFMAFMCRLTN